MKCPPGLVHSQMKWDRVCPPPKSRGEVSSDFDQRTSVQRWGQKTVCEAWLRVLNGTWVEVAEADAQECDFLWPHDGLVLTPHVSALFCGCWMDSHAPCNLSHLPLVPHSPSWSLHHGRASTRPI